jgi:hypothetical protein
VRLELSIPSLRRPLIARHVLACDPARGARPYFLHRVHARPDDKGPIPFSRYLEKHNRQDRDDLTREALPPFLDAPGAPPGQRLDVLA